MYAHCVHKLLSMYSIYEYLNAEIQKKILKILAQEDISKRHAKQIFQQINLKITHCSLPNPTIPEDDLQRIA